ncbi:MAG: RecX family transcriptional regulator [Candidatus Omnitrophica bacterium]|nr:RecX family transcriptional regulator [Candidatus Omnitrophota bacterium]
MITEIVEACSREGLVDDRVAAKLWAETLVDRGYALSAIRAQLSERGFDDSTVEHALKTLRASEGDEQRARAMVATLRKTSSLRARNARASVSRRLARRGFDPELINRLLAHDE